MYRLTCRKVKKDVQSPGVGMISKQDTLILNCFQVLPLAPPVITATEP